MKLTTMAINPSKFNTVAGTKAMLPFMHDEMGDLEEELRGVKTLDFIPVMQYIVLLYSQDSVLNTKPQKPLNERQVLALRFSGYDINDDGSYEANIDTYLIKIDSEQTFNVIFSFLCYQKNHLWSEIVTLETQMEENQRLRLAPVTGSDQGKTFSAFVNKDKMTDQYKKWYGMLKEYYDEFFGDNEDLKKHVFFRHEDMVMIENYAI